jgi:error-prone DNA polymerase
MPLRLGLRMVKGLANAMPPHSRRPRRASVRLGRGRLAAFRRAGRGAGEARRRRRFAGLGLDRRQALWRVRGLGDAPLPLFAAADARDVEPEVGWRR